MSYISKPNHCFLDGMMKFRVIGGRQVYKFGLISCYSTIQKVISQQQQ